MNFSVPLSWFQAAVGKNLTVEDIQRDVALLGFDVQVHASVYTTTNVVIARVIETMPHPGASRLKICTVDDGDAQGFKSIVCGCPKVRPGIMVPLARVGAVLPQLSITASVIRGVASDGMLCSRKDLGVPGPEGLWEVSEHHTLGAEFFEALAYTTPILVFEVTANRCDCLSVEGLVREWRALVDHQPMPQDCMRIPPALEAVTTAYPRRMPESVHSACWARISLRADFVLPEVDEQRLRCLGVYTEHTLLNVQRLAEISWGLPLHVYASLGGGDWKVEVLQQALPFVGINSSEYTLDAQDHVVCHGDTVVALAGMLGGQDSRYQGATQNVWLEAVALDRLVVHATQQRLSLHTEAALRHARGTAPGLVLHTLMHMLAYLEAYDAVMVHEMIHYAPPVPSVPQWPMDTREVAAVLGYDPQHAAIEALECLGFTCSHVQDTLWQVGVPWYRNDIEGPRDFTEEIIRYVGYAMLEETMETLPITNTVWPLRTDTVDDILLDQGFDETIHYSFIDALWDSRYVGDAHSIHLHNPLSTELSVMRRTLLAGMLKTAHYRQDHQHSGSALYEWGRIFFLEQGTVREKNVLGLLMAGPRQPLSALQAQRPTDVYDLSACVQHVCARLRVPVTLRMQHNALPMLHPGAAAELYCQGEMVGILGMVHPQLTEGYTHAFYAEIDAHIFAQDLPTLEFQPFHKQPAVYRDISLYCKENILYQNIDMFLKDLNVKELKFWQVIDIYYHQGAGCTKSILLRLCLSADDKTLRDADVEIIMSRLQQSLVHHLGVELRRNENIN